VTTGRTTAHGELDDEVPCRECGRSIVVGADGAGTKIADRAAFLRDHRDCLLASGP